MQAIRTRGACIARQARSAGLRQAPRRHAHDHHHHVEPVNESIGTGFWATVATIPACVLVYNISTPDKDGNAPWLTRKIHEYHSWQEEWAERSHLHTKAVEQAGFDRALFLHAPANRDVDLRFPEALQNHAQRNIPAGHIANMDHVVEHYRKQHLEQEAIKANRS
ncbi:NADH:ubiquinone oxidoreductase 17.8kD subunit [Plectosphaerella plurivora]|uniref:NADH:ubiquinone oxidoreductase 17.8kD subunit n=1 Tax=Plectosphaerella plurivora TaxID=936078 RepID=A0A9P9A8V0_9PEZI|nr:NADH:ubiquinone oxidoreductase 17.8kD subunit [Plectosphaerella plurivora]